MHSRPWHLWVVGVLAILWNAYGAFDYVMTQTANEAHLAALTAEQLEYYLNMPWWADAIWAIAIWSSVVASILLLLGRRWSAPLFQVGFAFMAITFLYNYIFANAPESTMVQTLVTAVIAVVAVLLMSYSRKMAAAGHLR